MVVVKQGARLHAYRIHEGGSAERVSHKPWFLSTKVPRDVEEFEETDLTMYIFDVGALRFVPTKPVFKVYAAHPAQVPRLSKEVEKLGGRVSMANVRYSARTSMDLTTDVLGVKTPIPLHFSPSDVASVMEELLEKSSKLKVLAFDIEVKPSKPGAFPSPGDPVFLVSYAVTDLGRGSEEVQVLEGDEVHDFAKVLRSERFDYVVGFVSKSFDIPYLTAYIEDLKNVLHPQAVVLGSRIVPHVDLAELVASHGSGFGLSLSERLALDDVADALGVASEEELEIESSVDRTKIFEEYRRDREKVVKYSAIDSLLTARIARVILPPTIMIYALTGISPSAQTELPSQGALAEYAMADYLVRKHGACLELRSRSFDIGELDNGLGIYRSGSKNYASFTPPTYFENVAVFDFNMLYPTIYFVDGVDAVKMRLCSDGFRIPLISGGGVKWFSVCTEPGMVHEWLSWLYHARAVTKKLKKERGLEVPDQAIKILANSAYGIFSKARGNGLNELVSAYIFFRANQILNVSIGFVEAVLGKRVVYGDTDSLFVVVESEEDATKIEEALNEFLTKRFGSAMSVKLERIFSKVAFTGKKNYVGITSDGKVVIKGITRFEAPQIVKERLEDIVREVLGGADPLTVMKRVISSAPTRKLFGRSTKRLLELYDEEEGRFKRPTHSASKAVIARYLIEREAVGGVVELERDLLPDYPISALYLPANSSIYILLEESGSGAKCFAARVDAEPLGNRLRVRVSGSVVELDRERIEVLALRFCSTILKILSKVREAIVQRRLV